MNMNTAGEAMFAVPASRVYISSLGKCVVNMKRQFFMMGVTPSPLKEDFDDELCDAWSLYWVTDQRQRDHIRSLYTCLNPRSPDDDDDDDATFASPQEMVNYVNASCPGAHIVDAGALRPAPPNVPCFMAVNLTCHEFVTSKDAIACLCKSMAACRTEQGPDRGGRGLTLAALYSVH